jgi:hypothetical protein
VSGTSNVTTAALTRTAQTGLYSHSHAVLARERLIFRVAIDNAIVGTDAAINITATLPSAVDAAGSLAATTLARDGDASRYGLAGPVPLLASSWHLLFVPVLRAGGGGGFFADPGLAVRLQLSAATSSNGTAPGNTTTALMFSGIWSSSNGSYVVPFKLPANGSYAGTLSIWPNTTTTAFLVRVCAVVCCDLACLQRNSNVKALHGLGVESGCCTCTRRQTARSPLRQRRCVLWRPAPASAWSQVHDSRQASSCMLLRGCCRRWAGQQQTSATLG